MARTRATIFRADEERWNLALGVLLLIAAIAMAITRQPGDEFKDSLFLAGNFLFLNTTHIAFSAVILLGLKESRDWIGEIPKSRKIFFLAGILATYITIYVICLISFHLVNGSPGVYVLAWAVIRYWPAFHSIGQVKGLSFLYNRNAGPDPRFSRLVKWERRLFFLFPLVYILDMLPSYFKTYAAKLPFQISLAFAGDHAWRLQATLTALVICLVLGILAITAMQSRWIGFNKLVYNSRLFIYAFGPFYGIYILTGFFHGIEYFFVYRTIKRTSVTQPNSRLTALSVALITVAAAIPVLQWKFNVSAAITRDHFVWILAQFYALTLPLNFAHYFVDGIIFRFRDPINQKYFGKLLAPAYSAP